VPVWSHELDFWGGDLPSLRTKLDHVNGLADVLYLNPIHDALTNHKYDATNYDKVAPEYGTQADFDALAKDVHSRKMRLVLDGVFNHLGKSNPIFKEAQTNSSSKYRDWFLFGKDYPAGYRAWAQVPNLPEINLENESARRYLWLDSDSIVALWLKSGADGWRLDVAHEVGPEYLKQITDAAHKYKPGSVVIGEVWNYPSRWTNSLDGLLNMFMGQMIFAITNGEIAPRQAGPALNELVEDCGIEPLLRSWLVLGNHDTARIATRLPLVANRHFAQSLQFTLPGSPLIYYGDEIGMLGGDDPKQRAPLRWEQVKETNPDLVWTRKLVAMRRKVRALRIGDYRSLAGDKLFGFIRTTEKPLESTMVVANPSDAAVTETMVVPDPTVMGFTLLKDVLSGDAIRVDKGTATFKVPAKTVMVFTIDPEAISRGQYKRLKDGW
jgi:glycosidase